MPTLGKQPSGIYTNWEPYFVIPATDRTALKDAFQEVLLKGSPPIPTQPRGNDNDAKILKLAGVKTFSAFYRGAVLWGVEDWNGIYTILPYKPGKPRGWVPDRERKTEFPAGTDEAEVADCLVSMIQAANTGG
ncbi:MAG TPA: hypothetical protein VL899_12830 [Alphaproteobacteria bacterium]|jgi:hypothetical protein|nr:hypothetical protein [Alphaproteobacteria bacterium]